MHSPQALIATKRDRRTHSSEEIRDLVRGLVDGSIKDYQASSWLMAAYLNGLDSAETTELTLAMADSGERLDLSGLPKPWVDKHSTGGVGDKVTLVALPLMAACGITAVKMSGRGLGITGGTIDKLESIPGFRTDLSPSELVAQANQFGIALTGQSPNLAPADKILYGLRDATATVDCVPLIVSSILSKKIAGGAETVVLDVKCGSGAFMRDLGAARNLAAWLKDIGTRAGLNLRILITDMDQPLGSAIGNSLEVLEALSVLRGDVKSSVGRLAIKLVALALEASGTEASLEAAEARCVLAIQSGGALTKAREWLTAQGADPAFVDQAESKLPLGPVVRKVFIHSSGYLARADAGALGQLVVDLGGGRAHKEDLIDHGVGIQIHVAVGDEITDNEHCATVFAKTEEEADEAAQRVLASLYVTATPTEARPLVIEVL
ncbi:MAG: thymidine phosphorylase [Armatimonadetes bacterium]|nr:thymidine phosphorylase [Armatimonadota bacterium]